MASGKKVALITGIAGQDGSYLAELLLGKGYCVHGLIRRSSLFNLHRVEHLYKDPFTHTDDDRFKLHYGDMTDGSGLMNLIAKVRPSEIYNLAAQSFVKVSFEVSEYTTDVDGTGVLKILEAIRACGLEKEVRFYQASSSEMFGKVQEIPQSETTPFYPRSPYAVAKLYGYWITINFREAYNMYACNGILFNHESPRRGETFVTRKITRGVAKIVLGYQEKITLGNLNAKRDWGHAKDYVHAMWLLLHQDEVTPLPSLKSGNFVPKDYVIATGDTHSVREFVEVAFEHVGMHIEWEGSGLQEVGKDSKTSKILVNVSEQYFRPTEVDILLGDPSKARSELGWKPTVTFKELVSEMVDADLLLMSNNAKS